MVWTRSLELYTRTTVSMFHALSIATERKSLRPGGSALLGPPRSKLHGGALLTASRELLQYPGDPIACVAVEVAYWTARIHSDSHFETPDSVQSVPLAICQGHLTRQSPWRTGAIRASFSQAFTKSEFWSDCTSRTKVRHPICGAVRLWLALSDKRGSTVPRNARGLSVATITSRAIERIYAPLAQLYLLRGRAFDHIHRQADSKILKK